jgi:hypothetical protein
MTLGEPRGEQELGSPLFGALVGVGVEQSVYGDSDGPVKGEREGFVENSLQAGGGTDQTLEPEFRDFKQEGRAGKGM